MEYSEINKMYRDWLKNKIVYENIQNIALLDPDLDEIVDELNEFTMLNLVWAEWDELFQDNKEYIRKLLNGRA